MEDATKALARAFPDPSQDPEDQSPESEGQGATSPDLSPGAHHAQPDASTSDRKQDRWFLEQRGNRKVPKRLEIPNEIQITNAGPLKVTGNITLIEEDGTVTHANHLTLCRCGASKMKPICDDQHLEIEFFDSGSIQRASDCLQISRPQTITITCVENGPLNFRGFVRIFNRKGQECLTMRGSLCRCGKSTKKPFCDCQ